MQEATARGVIQKTLQQPAQRELSREDILPRPRIFDTRQEPSIVSGQIVDLKQIYNRKPINQNKNCSSVTVDLQKDSSLQFKQQKKPTIFPNAPS